MIGPFLVGLAAGVGVTLAALFLVARTKRVRSYLISVAVLELLGGFVRAVAGPARPPAEPGSPAAIADAETLDHRARVAAKLRAGGLFGACTCSDCRAMRGEKLS